MLFGNRPLFAAGCLLFVVCCLFMCSFVRLLVCLFVRRSFVRLFASLFASVRVCMIAC